MIDSTNRLPNTLHGLLRVAILEAIIPALREVEEKLEPHLQ